MTSLGAEAPILLALVIGLAVIIVILLRDIGRRERYRYYRGPFRLLRFKRQQKFRSVDVTQQLFAVMASSFEKRRILSGSEYRLFTIVESEIAAQRNGYRVFAQTNLGEVLKSDNDDAFHSINSKRVDILVVDRGGWPFLAIEYQGAGHYQGTGTARDAVKRAALRRAGVRYLEFGPAHTEAQIRSRLRELFPPQRRGPISSTQSGDASEKTASET
jgi:hypothetical protein